MIYSTAKKRSIKKGVDVLSIKKAEVDHYWDLLKFMIIQGLKHGGDLMSEKTLKREIKEGYHQLFIMFGSEDGVESKVYGVFVTRITDHDNKRQCEVVLLAGKQRELWEDKVTLIIEELAKSNGCDRVAILARPGWKKLGDRHGYKVKNIEFVKDISRTEEKKNG
jgi:hypothetical protein